MGQQIIKQPNGRYAIWSSIVDDFLADNLTQNDVISFIVELEVERITTRIINTIKKLNRGEKPYYQFTLSYNEALETIKRVHKGKDN